MAREYRLGPVRKGLNTVMTALLRRGVAAPQKNSFLLTTRGRKSGLERTLPINIVVHDGERWLVSPYGDVGWVHNVRADPALRLWRGKQSESLEAEEVDAAIAGPILRQYLREVRITAPYFDAKEGAPVEEFAAEATRHPVFRLKAVSA